MSVAARPIVDNSGHPFDGVSRRRVTEAEAGARELAVESVETLASALSRAWESLYAVKALFGVKPDVQRGEFRRFVQSALERSPELQALEWIPRVAHEQRDEFERRARADGLADFAFTEMGTGGIRPAGNRPEYWPVYYAEPERLNRGVLGLDLAANPCRRAAMDLAAHSALPIATHPLRLAQSSDDRLGYLLVLAVPGADGVLIGYGLAAFRVDRLVDQVFSSLLARGLRMEIRDQAAGELVYAAGGPPISLGGWSFDHEMPMAGRVLRFTFQPTADFCVADPEWLGRAAVALRHTNEILEERVAERTAQLAELNAALQHEVAERRAAAAELRSRSDALERANRELRQEIERRRMAEIALQQADEQLAQLNSAEMERWGVAGFVGRSAAVQRVVQSIQRLAELPRTNVIISGESGTGKELVARAIHYGGAHARGPFVVVQCSGVSPEGWDTVLFGDSKTGTPEPGSGKRGSLDAAQGGTLFLDALHELPLKQQARLFRWLNSPPAGVRAPVRVIGATAADLPALVAAGRFRADLYYRLLDFQLPIAPLRERLEDVPALATLFVRRFAVELKRPVPKLAAETIARLVSHSYPGNVRELRNTLERAILAAPGGTLRPEHLSFAQPVTSGDPGGFGTGSDAAVPLNLKQAELVLMKRALAATNGNVCAAARLLGINRARLYRRDIQPLPST